MSATNRGAVREANDFYATPTWLIEAIVPELWLRGDNVRAILEPAAGDGAIVDVLRKAFPKANVVARDIRDGHDFLTAPPEPRFDIVITNPPYLLAREFVERAHLWLRKPINPGDVHKRTSSMIVMLLRVNFLGGQKRAKWLRANTPSIYVSPRRPSFTGRGTDATEYAWFIWQKSPVPSFNIPTVGILDTDQLEEGNLFAVAD